MDFKTTGLLDHYIQYEQRPVGADPCVRPGILRPVVA